MMPKEKKSGRSHSLKHLVETKLTSTQVKSSKTNSYLYFAISKAGVVEPGLRRLAEDQVDIYPGVMRVQMSTGGKSRPQR